METIRPQETGTMVALDRPIELPTMNAAPPALPQQPAKRSRRLPTRFKPLAIGVVVAGFAAAASFGWKSSVDRGTTIRMERAASKTQIATLTRDKEGLASQISALQSSLSTCKEAVAEIASVVLILADYPELVGQAATAAASYDIGELGRVLGVMQQLDERLGDVVASSNGAIGSCTNTSAA